ncbi:MAG: ADP-glyceromanno-heptose 6-epimerase [Bacteroidia bacterium]|nr:ADP-glyceromanno-heptose 6-epimerase [Bacteroidia bacterium]MCF8425995.1 ADP-glyceromanno-heptose 6-epimerase [Bacteroidia bacterium]MCF8447022.1 ADP-glyceromanno-heptose 6-epimerase [Bacteroidia bacterium]
MIVITGAEGFIGSCLVAHLNNASYTDLVLVDDFGHIDGRQTNLLGKKFNQKVERKAFFQWMETNAHEVQFVFHIGARTDTTEKDEQIFKELNLDFSKSLFNICVKEGIPLVYASSAATYGEGELGYSDQQTDLQNLKPMNPYGRSKNDFDKWVLDQPEQPYFWAGLKFFNVYGPNEYHKGRMASVVLHAYHQIKETGEVKLFQSHRADYKYGEQKRDFIYVKDLCDVCLFLMHHRKSSGLYNLGSGQARTWNSLAYGLFNALSLAPKIQYIPIPEDIRDTYQYFTEAKMDKLIAIGYTKPFTSLEDGIKDYVLEYLEKGEGYY